MAPTPTCDSAVITLLPWLPTFLPQAFPITVPSLTASWSVPLQSTAALTLGLLHNPSTPAPGCCSLREANVPFWSLYGCGKDCLILIPFRLPQISCFTLSLHCFSSDSDNCPSVGAGPLPAEGRSSPTNTSVSPASFLCPTVLRGSIHSFLLVRYCCSFSAGVLPELLCVEAYCWCVHGERCSSCLPTPPPSCSLYAEFLSKCVVCHFTKV